MTTIEQIDTVDPDLMLEVSTNGGGGDASRAFRAMDELIKALSALDQAMLPGMRAGVETAILLENVRSHSVLGLLHHALELPDGPSKKGLVEYLNRGTADVVEWLGRINEPQSEPLSRVIRRLLVCAQETGIASDLRFEPPSTSAVLGAALQIHRAHQALSPTDTALLRSNGSTIPFGLASQITAADIEAAASVWRIQNNGMELLLVADTPDYAGTGIWGFFHDGRKVSAAIEDVAWLSLFHARTVNIRPGDVVRVVASIESLYGASGELIGARYTIHAISELMQTGQRF